MVLSYFAFVRDTVTFSPQPKVRLMKHFHSVFDMFKYKPSYGFQSHSTCSTIMCIILYPGSRQVTSYPGTETPYYEETGSQRGADCCSALGAAEVSAQKNKQRRDVVSRLLLQMDIIIIQSTLGRSVGFKIYLQLEAELSKSRCSILVRFPCDHIQLQMCSHGLYLYLHMSK